MGIDLAMSKEFGIDAMISFTSTTVDDFAVMLYFFSLAEKKHGHERSKYYVSIIVSFILGYTIVGVTALVSLIFGMVLSKEYIALAGFIPLFAGFHTIYETLVERGIISPWRCKGSNTSGGNSNDNTNRDSPPPSYSPISTRDVEDGSSHGVEMSDLKSGGGGGGVKSKSSNGNGNKIPTTANRDKDKDTDSRVEHRATANSSKDKDKDKDNDKNKSKDKDNDRDTLSRNARSQNGKTSSTKSSFSSASSSSSYSDDGDDTWSRERHGSHGNSDTDDSGRDSDTSSGDDFDISGPVQASIDSTTHKFLGIFTWDAFWKHYKDPINWEVLMITLASGSDHVVIYNALMMLETSVWQVCGTVLIYYVILVVHTVLAITLIRCKWIAKLFQEYSILLIICLMVGTGIYILKDSIIFQKSGTEEAAQAAAEVALAGAT